MSIAKITLTGQENYLARTNKSLFDYMSLPTGIDKDNLIDNILMECGEFEVLYSDPEFMRSSIGVWSTKHYRTFEKWITALNIEYNPLENYDRFEDYTDKRTENSTENVIDKNSTDTSSKTDASGKSEQNGNTEDLTSAFDSGSYQPADKHEIDTDEKHEDTTETKSNISYGGNTDTTGQKTDDSVHVGRIHGNIGVTTSQQMLQSELDIAKFNIINEITKIFMQDLLICVYE